MTVTAALTSPRPGPFAGPTFITGGTLVDSKETAPNEIRAKSSQGGQTHHLTKGDVITIPANTPHWFKEIPTQPIAYYAVNIEN